jgi:uncharacterized protein (TIGR02284 family)
MASAEINALNDITKLLIDSRKGYEKAGELIGDEYTFASELAQRASERAKLVAAFQAHVQALGDAAETDGSALGTAHRGFMDFTSVFRDDSKAAFSAIDDGEEYLAKKIESKLDEKNLSIESRDLLTRALASAKSGESFAARTEQLLKH